MKDGKLQEGKCFNVALTEFATPIEPEQSGKIIIESSIEDINVMRAIKNAQNVTVEIDEGVLILTDGEQIAFGKQLKK